MSVLVVNQGIENQHTAKLLVELVAQGLVIIKQAFSVVLRRIRPIGTKEVSISVNSRHLEARIPFQFSKSYCTQLMPILSATLTGIILAVRLVSGVRSASVPPLYR